MVNLIPLSLVKDQSIGPLTGVLVVPIYALRKNLHRMSFWMELLVPFAGHVLAWILVRVTIAKSGRS